MTTTMTLRAMSDALVTSKVSSQELTQEHLQRLHADNLNCFITIADERAMEQARAADEMRYNAQALTGIPIAHKDIFCTDGLTTTCGSRMLANFTAPYNAHVVDLLDHAGVVTSENQYG